MVGASLAFVVVVYFIFVGLCGLASLALAERARLSRPTAFGWGFSLGVAGVVVVALVAAKRRGLS